MSSPARTTRRTSQASPLPSHPLGEELPGGAHGGARRSAKGASSAVGGGPPIYVILGVLLLAGGLLFTQFGQQPAGGQGPEAPTARRSTLEREAAQPAPPADAITREEAAIFEQAAEEHYGLPPGYQVPFFSLEDEVQQVSPEDEEEAELASDPDHELEHQQHGEQEQREGQPRPRRLGQTAEAAAEEAAAAAAVTFDPAVHQAYLDLPAWPEADDAVLRGAWNYSERVWDYGAHLPMTKVLSWDNPRLVLFPSFLSPDEVRHMIRVSQDNLERSEVLVADGEDTQSDIRTSFGFWPEADEVTDAITERMHRAIGVPQAFGEGLYVLNYQINQKYEAHNDHCMDVDGEKVAEPACLDFLKRAGGPDCGPGRGGPTCGDRVATFILYLKSPTKGGKTAFPESDITKAAMGDEHRPGNSPDEWYCEDDRVLSAAPPAGTGVLFWDYRPSHGPGTGSFQDGSAEPNAGTVYAAMHSGCPVLEGEKYIVTRWIRSAGFDYA